MVADKVADMVADMVADVVADMVAKKIYIDININMEIQFGERLKAYPACASPKLWGLICLLISIILTYFKC